MPKLRNSLNVDPDEKDPRISRRSFLALLVWRRNWSSELDRASVLGFLYPNAMKIPPQCFH